MTLDDAALLPDTKFADWLDSHTRHDVDQMCFTLRAQRDLAVQRAKGIHLVDARAKKAEARAEELDRETALLGAEIGRLKEKRETYRAALND
jgi:hypothetical protein